MNLTLKVLAFKNAPVANADIVSVSKSSATIGRSNDNSLVLPDAEKFVSRHHANIKLEQDCYVLTDTSLGGVLVINANGQETKVNHSSLLLNNRDILKIGEYEILVNLVDKQADDVFLVNSISVSEKYGDFENKDNSTLDIDLNNNSVKDISLKFRSIESPFPNLSSAQVNIIPDFSVTDLLNTRETNSSGEFNISPLSLASEQGFAIESKTQLLAQSNTANINDSGNIDKADQILSDGVLFNAFLKGASIKQTQIDPSQQQETLEKVGKMFRMLVDKTVAVLKSRAKFKEECGIDTTILTINDNNPLKFCISVDDALLQLLENQGNGYLNSVDAIESGFKDIQNHQLAMQAGIQASLSKILESFAPNIIEQQTQSIVFQKKAKYWEQYKSLYQKNIENAQESIFGEEFVKAYEKQMRDL
jgi:type VI secretion system FHA domain protein